MRILFLLLILFTPNIVLAQEKSAFDFSAGEESKEDKEQFSITQKQIEGISKQCGLNTECIDDKCEALFPDSRLFSIECYARIREYQKETIPESKWSIQRSASAMDDSKTVFVWVEADNFITGWPDKSVRPTLFIRCKENKTEIIVQVGMSPNPEVGNYNKATVRLRLDEGKPFRQSWNESTNGESLFAPRSIQLTKKINKSKKMLFEFTPYNSNPQLAEFDVRGLEPYLKELANTCKWKL